MVELESLEDLKRRRLREACDYARYAMADLIDTCRHGMAVLHETSQACGVTQVYQSGEHRVCIILVVAGTLKGVQDLEAQITAYARQEGCQAVQTIGRPGFEKVYNKLADGFRPIGTVYEKVL